MIRAMVSGATTALILAGLLPGVIAVGPMVESRLFPVLINEKVKDVTRADNKMCWNYSGFKTRDAVRVTTRWLMRSPDGISTPIIVSHGDRSFEPGTAVDGNSEFQFYYCTLLPAEPGSVMSGDPRVLSDAYDGNSIIARIVVYRTNYFWNLISSGPEIVIPR